MFGVGGFLNLRRYETCRDCKRIVGLCLITFYMLISFASPDNGNGSDVTRLTHSPSRWDRFWPNDNNSNGCLLYEPSFQVRLREVSIIGPTLFFRARARKQASHDEHGRHSRPSTPDKSGSWQSIKNCQSNLFGGQKKSRSHAGRWGGTLIFEKCHLSLLLSFVLRVAAMICRITLWRVSWRHMGLFKQVHP